MTQILIPNISFVLNYNIIYIIWTVHTNILWNSQTKFFKKQEIQFFISIWKWNKEMPICWDFPLER